MIPLLLFLLGCVGVYVGTIVAAFSMLLRLSLRLLAERHGRHDLLGRYLDDPPQLFVPARLLLGMIYALATVLLAILIGGNAGLQWMGVLLVSVAAFMLLTEHVLPQLAVRYDPVRVLAFLLPSFHVLARALSPVTVALIHLGRVAPRERYAGEPAPDRSNGADATADVPHMHLKSGDDQSLIRPEERRLLQSIVDFGNTLVREVMTPRPDIVSTGADLTLDELRALFAEQEYSRIPVQKENLDDILGFVFVKDLIQLAGMAGSERPIPSLLRTAYAVPETKRVADLLREFQRQQVQIALVVDEYGGTAGLVTLEDLLEEIVGEIRDEYDVEVEPIVDEGYGVFIVSGKVDIDKVTERLEMEIEREGFETIGGYLLARLGRVPAAGEVLDLDGLTIEVLEAERRRVHRVRIRRRQPVGSKVE